jgi:Kef-type K+ transport system membrane component KefB
MSVSTSALWGNLGILALLFVGKMVAKLTGVFPLARLYTAPHAVFTTLLMSTGLTFGTITSLYGLSADIIDRTQFSLLIAVVVLSAIVPTAIAQRFYSPTSEEQRDLTAPVPRLASGAQSRKAKPDLGQNSRAPAFRNDPGAFRTRRWGYASRRPSSASNLPA